MRGPSDHTVLRSLGTALECVSDRVQHRNVASHPIQQLAGVGTGRVRVNHSEHAKAPTSPYQAMSRLSVYAPIMAVCQYNGSTPHHPTPCAPSDQQRRFALSAIVVTKHPAYRVFRYECRETFYTKPRGVLHRSAMFYSSAILTGRGKEKGFKHRASVCIPHREYSTIRVYAPRNGTDVAPTRTRVLAWEARSYW